MPVHAITDSPFGDTTVAVYKRKTILTDAQIKTLPSVGVEVVPAPGANKMIIPIRAFVRCKIPSAGLYTFDPGSALVLSLGYIYMSGFILVNGILQNADYGASFPIPSMEYITTGPLADKIAVTQGEGNISAQVNQALLIRDDYVSVANYGGGSADNTLEVTVCYSIIDL